MAKLGYINVINPKDIKDFTFAEMLWMKYIPTVTLEEALKLPEEVKLLTYAFDDEFMQLGDKFLFDYSKVYEKNFKFELVELCKKYPDIFVQTETDPTQLGDRKYISKVNFSCQGEDVDINKPKVKMKAYPEVKSRYPLAGKCVYQPFIESDKVDGYSIVVGLFADGSVYCLVNQSTDIVGAGFEGTMWCPLIGTY